MQYNNRLKELRLEKGLTQEEFAKKINLTRGAYKQYELQYDIIPLPHLINACNYLDVSLDYIFEFTNIQQYSNVNKEINYKEAGKRLKELRKHLKFTQNKLASTLNIDRSTLSKYESGTHLIATIFLYNICKNYNISADYLLARTNIPKIKIK